MSTLADVLPDDPVTDPINQAISTEELTSLVECLGRVLSPLESQVLAMYLEGRSYEEVAERLDCNPKSVDNALQRVKRKVETHLNERNVLDDQQAFVERLGTAPTRGVFEAGLDTVPMRTSVAPGSREASHAVSGPASADGSRLVFYFTGPFAGHLGDRLGPRPMALLGATLLAAGLALAGANRRDEAPSPDDDGILTAEELAYLDLRSPS